MVPIEKKPAPGDHESSLKIFLAKLFLARCPCANSLVPSIKTKSWPIEMFFCEFTHPKFNVAKCCLTSGNSNYPRTCFNLSWVNNSLCGGCWYWGGRSCIPRGWWGGHQRGQVSFTDSFISPCKIFIDSIICLLGGIFDLWCA